MQAGNRVGGAINIASGATGALQAAVADRAIRVTSYVLCAAGAGSATFKSASTAISGVIPFAGASVVPFASGYSPGGHVQTVVGEALNLTSVGTDLDGHWTGILI
jgi:hypothetical protein